MSGFRGQVSGVRGQVAASPPLSSVARRSFYRLKFESGADVGFAVVNQSELAQKRESTAFVANRRRERILELGTAQELLVDFEMVIRRRIVHGAAVIRSLPEPCLTNGCKDVTVQACKDVPVDGSAVRAALIP